MSLKPPQPLAIAFLVCRDIFQDKQTSDYLLLAPHAVNTIASFPATLGLSFFFVLTGGHGTYLLTLQVYSSEGDLVGDYAVPEPFKSANPLSVSHTSWRGLRVCFPRPGRYDLILLANGEELARHPFLINLKGETTIRK